MQFVDLKQVQVSPTENQSTFYVGDQIELRNLDTSMYEMTAVKLEENQVKIQINI